MTSHGENGGTRNERTVSVFSANCEKKKRSPMDCTGRDPYLSWVESALNYSVFHCTSVDLMHLEAISAIRRWGWISRGDVFREQLNLIRVHGRAQERDGGKNVAGSAIIQPWLAAE